MNAPPRLALEHISKQYPAVKANDDVSLTVQPGEIHAILGENGAGKSTLMKIVFGAVQPDEGTVAIDGKVVTIRNPHEAKAQGIAMVFQHFSLFDTLTVAENVWLGLDTGETLAQVSARINAKAGEYGLPIDPTRPVHSLSVGERQRVEIIRALLANPKILILDEPTSVLTPQAVQTLFLTLRQLAQEGCSILYISHKLDEIRELCHACTVMRGGKVTGVVDPRQESNASLSRLMIGAEPPQLVHREASLGDVALEVKGLSLAPDSAYGVPLSSVTLQLRAGEVLGIAGVSGNGQQELLAALSGEDRRAAAGTLALFGTDIARASPHKRRRLGLHFVPEERLGRGAVPMASLAANTLLTRRETVKALGWIDVGATRALAAKLIERFKVKAGGPDAHAKSLSGGNLQKFIVGREFDAAPKLLIVSQPTWGVDVGAAAQIRGELLALRDAGCAVLVVSEELDELFELSDRLVVIARGKLSPSIATRDATVERIGQWMAGLFDTSAGGSAPHKEVAHAAA
ncbi:MAG TPA: ABC transporter ATP-binding protein [Burkholderiaceae bacterium]|nr:ABC transporter ATP-binding protein [Burkholderiaceae bacterium]